MSTETKLVEIKRVVSDDDGNNVASKRETIDVDDVKGFRPWHKGAKDKSIAGEMTLVKVMDKKDPSGKLKTILIEESYDSFLNRMGSRVEVRKLSNV